MKQKELVALIESYGFKALEDNINLVAIRTNNKITNAYDDILYYYYRRNGDWQVEEADVTTKPGYFYTDNHLNPKGVAVLKPGLWKDCFVLGQHNGKYPALVQCAPVTVYRDKNRDRVIDKGVEDTGIFGINIHRSSEDKETEEVNKYSAGCIAFKSPSAWFRFINLVTNNINRSGFYSLLLLDKKEEIKMATKIEPKMEKTVESKGTAQEIEVSENLANSIRRFQAQFAQLNEQLGLMINGYLLANDIYADDYNVGFSEDLTKMILTKKEAKA